MCDHSPCVHPRAIPRVPPTNVAANLILRKLGFIYLHFISACYSLIFSYKTVVNLLIKSSVQVRKLSMLTLSLPPLPFPLHLLPPLNLTRKLHKKYLRTSADRHPSTLQAARRVIHVPNLVTRCSSSVIIISILSSSQGWHHYRTPISYFISTT